MTTETLVPFTQALERYEPRVVHVQAETNRIITVDDAVATLLS